LWFARFVKTRSLAARLCTAGRVAVNGIVAAKPNHAVRIGDTIVLTVGEWQRASRVVALGNRRGPASEARTLYQEAAPAVRVAPAVWELLLADEAE
jgi:ribosome-associated heat shock protein Hsp15